MKTTYIRIRVTEKQKELIRNKAIKANKNMSSFVLDNAINGKTIDYSHLSKLVVTVNRIGNNINQAVKIMHTYYGFEESDFDYFKNEFESLKKLIEDNFGG